MNDIEKKIKKKFDNKLYKAEQYLKVFGDVKNENTLFAAMEMLTIYFLEDIKARPMLVISNEDNKEKCCVFTGFSPGETNERLEVLIKQVNDIIEKRGLDKNSKIDIVNDTTLLH